MSLNCAIIPYSPYYESVNRASMHGIVFGVGNNLFLPDAPVTRQDMYVIIYNAMEFMGLLPEFQIDQWIEFDDWELVSEYAYHQIQTLAKMNVPGGITGDSILNPRGVVIRVEALRTIAAYLDGNDEKLDVYNKLAK